MDTNQQENLSKLINRPGLKKVDKSEDETKFGDKAEIPIEVENENGPVSKKYNLYLTGLSISRELVLRFVLFLIVYVIFTRLLKIFIEKNK